jgi:hypothetical protein
MQDVEREQWAARHTWKLENAKIASPDESAIELYETVVAHTR